MPPWVLLDDQPAINPAFDAYMLGKVLWCMVSGKLKLHREDFRDRRFDLTKLYPNDPHMHIINTILEKTVVAREGDCLRSAQDLWLMVGALLEMMERGGQLWKDGVPKPCQVCGVGYYEPEHKGEPNASLQWSLNRYVNGVNQHVCVLRFMPFVMRSVWPPSGFQSSSYGFLPPTILSVGAISMRLPR